MTTVPADTPTPGPDHGSATAGSALDLPLSPVDADRWRLTSIVSTLAAAVAVLLAAASGYGALLGVTLALALVVAWGWPVLSGSYTPTATTVVLAVSAVAVVLAALRDDLRWLAAAVALGILLSFAGQLVRRTGREGLVLTLLASFGGLVVIASGTTAVVAANSVRGSQVVVIAMAAVAAAVLTDVLAGVRVLRPALGLVAVALAVLAAVVVGVRYAEIGWGTALAVGAATGSVSWSFRRVLALQPAMLGVRGQAAAGVGSVLFVGAIVHIFTTGP